MKSITTSRFWNNYYTLPQDIQSLADKTYKLWQINPLAKSLYFKRVGNSKPVYSVRIGLNYRALGLLVQDAVLWFWIGTHDEYKRLLKKL